MSFAIRSARRDGAPTRRAASANRSFFAMSCDVSLIAREQKALIERALASRSTRRDADADADAETSASLAPFARSSPTRLPYAFAAARLTSSDVLYDFGCGDGAVVIEAARRFGCACVGLELDEALVARAEADARERNVSHLCEFLIYDIAQIEAKDLDRGCASTRALAPTVVFLWLTGGGLAKLSPKLMDVYANAATPFRIITCVDALDSACDFVRDGAFASPTEEQKQWRVVRGAYAKYGVFVVPPRTISLAEWARGDAIDDDHDFTRSSPEST